MRRTLWSGLVVSVPLALAGLCEPAAAERVLDVYSRLAARDLRPAPLVPTTVPRTLAPIDRTLEVLQTRRRSAYGVRLVRDFPSGPGIIALSGGDYKNLRAALSEHRRLGYARKRIRVHGRRGYLLTRRAERVSRALVWVEAGVVYWMASGTPKKVSFAQLRATANNLDRLERGWFGSSSDPDSSAGAFAVTTRKTATVDLEFEAACTFPGSTEPTVRAGSARVTLLRRTGNTFAFDVAKHRTDDSEPWTGTATGTVSPTGIALSYQVAGTIQGYVCDSGPVTLTLDQRSN
jgi:hypothetical protein